MLTNKLKGNLKLFDAEDGRNKTRPWEQNKAVLPRIDTASLAPLTAARVQLSCCLIDLYSFKTLLEVASM